MPQWITVAWFGNITGGWNNKVKDAMMRQQKVILVKGEHRAEAQLRTPFTDQASISGYASQAVTEAAAKGIIKGKTETTFAPQDAATRAEAAVMIKQILQYLKFMN
ncbi:S-layer homology domain-containing protein [Paenibacillus sp. FSL K6-3166]|uniref:S-layer homology domain-containing protein n=1 Tax=unclassified Paenibacillus TaxID=185978 RepID=UPI000B9FF296|nr:S-layer homology domain-containing protein [Paenibacillus sp. VTT E-133291]OZQ98566.1 hypothetical protein CA598_00600 [Paenibacillus sp. VTT E-133291]